MSLLSHRRSPRWWWALLAGLALLFGSSAWLVQGATTLPTTPRFPALPLAQIDEGDEWVSLFVVLEGEPAARSALRAGRLGERAAALASRQRLAELEVQQDALAPRLAALGVVEVARLKRVANAFQVRAPVGRVADLAALPGVIRLDPVGLYAPQNQTSVRFVGAPAVWNPGRFDARGEGIRIGIIDSGIDYLHADFGGSGNVAAYDANDRTVIEPGSFPTARVVGGYDFVGDAYDASSSDPTVNTPIPDPDPLDCRDNGHGSHVAGSAAGGGVRRDGSAYLGPYTDAITLTDFLVGPGVAPRADLYALKVFGCSGRTNATVQALEWSTDPNGDGDLSDRLDVVNLSLGCEFSCGSPTQLLASDLLAELGTVVVAAAGNNGNTFYNSGDPGNANRAISVAASLDDGLTRWSSAISVTAPIAVAGAYPVNALPPAMPLFVTGPVSGTVVLASPITACSPLTNAAAIAGHIALLDIGGCDVATKMRHAQDAGATAVLAVNDQPGLTELPSEDGPGITIPGVLVSGTDGARLKQGLVAGLFVLMDAFMSLEIPTPERADEVASFSSRGPHALNGLLKPDLSAPGEGILSAGAGGGTTARSMSGTSMASPHVAGAAALLRQLRPGLPVEEVKALLMNTAAPMQDAAGHPYPESRVGAGRLQVDRAAAAPVTAMVQGEPGTVSLSFGALTLSEAYTATRTVRLTNHGSQPVVYTVTVGSTVTETGVVLRPAIRTVTVPAYGSAIAPFRFTADPSRFDMTSDPTTPIDDFGGSRHVLFEASGQIRFVSRDGQADIHLPYHAAVRPGVNFLSNGTVLAPRGSGLVSVTLPIFGSGVHPAPLVSAFQFGALAQPPGSGQGLMALTTTYAPAVPIKLKAVGAASDVASQSVFSDTTVYFGIAAEGSWTTPHPSVVRFSVYIDTTGDGAADFRLDNSNYSLFYSGNISNDRFVSVLTNFATGEKTIQGEINILPAGQGDTAPFNTDVLVLSAKAGDLGLTRDNATINYFATSNNNSTGMASFDVAAPAVDTAIYGIGGRPIFRDGAPIAFRADRERLPQQLLLLHHHNIQSAHMEIVSVLPDNATALSLSTLAGLSSSRGALVWPGALLLLGLAGLAIARRR